MNDTKTDGAISPAGTMTLIALARYLGISKEALHQWLKRDTGLAGLARVWPNGRRYWLRDEVDAWIRSRCFAPTAGDRGAA